MRWLRLFRSGDWLVLLFGVLLCASSFPLFWPRDIPERVQIMRGGQVFGVFDLSRNRRIDVPGPLGLTQVLIENQRARIVSDPGPHQYCVRQGWLEQSGEIAICAPNQISVQILGTRKVYDSLNY